MNKDSNQGTASDVNPKALLVMAVVMMLGVALGVVLGVALDNMAFIGIGIACGAAIGLALKPVLGTREEQDGP